MTQRGPEIPIFLEHLRGRKFEHAEYSERRFVQPYQRCLICGLRIAERPLAEASRAGMVSLHVIQGAAGPCGSQWQWVCESCYARYAEVAEWSVLPEGESIGAEAVPMLIREESGGAVRELVVRWDPEDVIGLAQNLGITLSEEECRRFWEKHARLFVARMNSAGTIHLMGLLQIEYPASQ